jgi:hypothetical protein
MFLLCAGHEADGGKERGVPAVGSPVHPSAKLPDATRHAHSHPSPHWLLQEPTRRPHWLHCKFFWVALCMNEIIERRPIDSIVSFFGCTMHAWNDWKTPNWFHCKFWLALCMWMNKMVERRRIDWKFFRLHSVRMKWKTPNWFHCKFFWLHYAWMKWLKDAQLIPL